MTFEASSPLLPHIRDGRLRALAVLSKSRLPDLPDVPTAVEIGHPGLTAALAKVGNVPITGPPEALAQLLVAENQKWAPIVRALNLKAE
jgi:tripartite-type tricarboxylate transporter receptor subunit TctC